MALLALGLALGSCGAGESNAGGQAQLASAASGGPVNGFEPTADDFARMGEGLLVWESNRSGNWRLWLRRLDGGGLVQLSPEEGDRQHCCPHISPDGTRVAYLSVGPEARHQFPENGLEGELRLLMVDGSGERALGPARAYCDHRAVVWRSDRELVHIDGQGRTRLLDLESGVGRMLIADGMRHNGWLVDASLRWAATAALGPVFAPFDSERGTVAARSPLGGCAPYFASDGVWGFWGAGAGGPINRFELATGRSSILLAKNDPRMPAGHGYLYFPMISRDGTLFAVGASADEHDHFQANYDVYVAELDPRTLEIVSTPLRYTTDPGTDRYPDVWRLPLPLGRHAGKAPFAVVLEPAGGGEWQWDFGDGNQARAPRGRHSYETPGVYRVEARQGERRLAGLVAVEPAAPPEMVGAEVRRAGQEVVVRFGEPVEVAAARAELASGRAIAELAPGADGRSLQLRLAERLEGPDRLRLAGITDRAQRPNELPATEVELAAPAWPIRRDGLIFLWEAADRPNLVFDRRIDADRAPVLEARGRARLDRHHAMVLGAGAFIADQEAAGYVRTAAAATHTFTLEALVTPAATASPGPNWIVSFGRGPNERNLALGQLGDRLVARVLTPTTGPDADQPQVDLGPIPLGRPSHVVVTYFPGRLAAYVDGELRVETAEVQGGLNRWRGLPLAFGDDARGGADWSGSLEAVALFDRALSAEEVRESFLRLRELLSRRTEPSRLRVGGRLTAVSTPPTLRQISPYREGLMVHELAVERVLQGSYDGERLRVVRWAIQDGQPLAAARARPGQRVIFTVEPFAANPQLEPLFLADTLEEDWELALYYEIED
jgi:hypothetical protein